MLVKHYLGEPLLFDAVQCNSYVHRLRNQWTNLACRNPNLWLVTKVKVWKGACQEGSPEVTSHTPGSAKKCEGMNLHTPKEFHFGSWTLSGLPNLQRVIVGIKTHWIEMFLISLEIFGIFGIQMFEMGSHDPFGHLKHKLWPKEGPRVKLPGVCEYLLHTFTTKVCTHIKPGWKWNYYIVVV